MITRKKKLSKKEIKEDKLVSFLYNIESFYEENKRRIFTYGLIFLVVVGAVYVYMGQRREENEKAGLELSRVMDIFNSGSYLEAIEGRQGTNIIGLKRLVEEYGSTENGETAKIYLANAYSYLGNYDEAFKYYQDYDGDIDVFKASAKAGIAGYYASKQEYKKAADLYKEAASITDIDPQNPDYMLDAAVNYIKAGEKEDSKVLLNKIKEDYKTSEAFKQVDKYLALADE